ncbi:hypothetical protein A2U01_0110894, partial [Trifolium medium]|nr:hypothetical protein [Trifolium medium]
DDEFERTKEESGGVRRLAVVRSVAAVV